MGRKKVGMPALLALTFLTLAALSGMVAKDAAASFYRDAIEFYLEDHRNSIREYAYSDASVRSCNLPVRKISMEKANVIRHEAKQAVLVECKKPYAPVTNYIFATISGSYYVDASTGLIHSVDEESVKVSWDHPYWGDLYDPPILRSIDSYAFVSANHQIATFGVRFSIYGREVDNRSFFGSHDAHFQITANDVLIGL